VPSLRRVYPLCLLAGFILAGFHIVLAGDFQPVSADELKMTSEPEAPGAPAIYLYRQVDRDDGRLSHEFNYARIKILTEEGRKYGDIDIPFLKGLTKISDIKARTIKPDGTAVNFDGKVYEKTVVKARGYKYLAKTFTMPEVVVGSIIEYSYMVDSDYLFDPRWILSADLFTKHAKFSFIASPNYSLHWSWPAGLPAGTNPPIKSGASVFLETQDVPAFQVEDYMPPENTLKMRVEFVYGEGALEKDQEKFWKEREKWRFEGFQSFVDRPRAMEQAVATIVAPGDAPEMKLQKIYARVQQLRNTSFDREKSEQEQKREKLKDNNNVEDVWKRGLGSARAMNYLYIALARAAGFEAYSVAVSSRDTYFFDPRLMNSQQLNNDVVLVKLNGKDIYLDPGTALAPYGFLPWSETGVAGLRLAKDTVDWVQTPLPGSSVTTIQRKADLVLSEEGTPEGTLTITFSGMEALWMRMDQRDQDDASRKTLLEDTVKESVPVGVEVELINQPDWNSSAPTLVAQFKLKVPGWVSGAGHRAFLPVGLFSSSEKHLFEHAERVHPIYFHYPYQKIDDINIALPLGWTVSSVPPPIVQDASAVGYTVKVEDNKGAVHIQRTLRSDMVIINNKQYDTLRRFFQVVRTGDEQQIILQPGH